MKLIKGRFKFTILGILFSLFCLFFVYLKLQKENSDVSFRNEIQILENKWEGRIGVSALDTGTNQALGFRENEYFPMGCTSKVIGVAAILKKSETVKDLLTKKIRYKKEDIISWSPITQKFLDVGMSVEALAKAAITHSDNPAMNLLLSDLGGIEGMNHFAKSMGDNFFNQTNGWPKEAYSGGLENREDSTTPIAMKNDLFKLILGDVLSLDNRERLTHWLKESVTGFKRIRAGVPTHWIVGDKTGTGALYGTTNDIAIIWPNQCSPLVLVVYFTTNDKNMKAREEIIPEVTQKVISFFSKNNPCLNSPR